MLTLDLIRAINASKTFKIKDDFKFVEFNDISGEAVTETEPTPDQLEIWAGVEISYDGEIPESYKALNLLIGDWVETHEDELTKTIHTELKNHLEENYPQAELPDLDNGDSSIWLDQLDYMPRVDREDNSMVIEIELVLQAEGEED